MTTLDAISAHAASVHANLSAALEHCECRPLNLGRSHHSHDCDDGPLVELRSDVCAAAEHLARAWQALEYVLSVDMAEVRMGDSMVRVPRLNAVELRAAIQRRLEDR